MKKLLSNTGTLIVIMLCLLVIAVYFGILSAINIYENNSTEGEYKEVSPIVQSKTQPATISEEEQELIDEYNELIEELEEAKSGAEEYLSQNNEIENFIKNQYGKAIQTDYSDYKTYKDKQKAMKTVMMPFYTESAYECTEYYKLTNSDETYTVNVETFGNISTVKYTRKIVYNRSITRAFYKNVSEISADVLLVINNKDINKTEYEILSLTNDNGKWKISDYELIQPF